MTVPFDNANVDRDHLKKEREAIVLSETYGTGNHKARIQAGYSVVLILFVLSGISVYASITEPRIPADRRPVIVSIAIGVLVSSCLLLFAPARWIRALGEIFGASDPIETILAEECKVVGRWVLVRQLIIVSVLLPVALAGIECCRNGNAVIGVALIVASGFCILLNFQHSIFKPTADVANKLELVLIGKHYVQFPAHYADGFLKQSILKSDAFFEVNNFWARSFGNGPLFGWGQYSTTGDALASGVFCIAEYRHRLPGPELAEVLCEFSSVHFDEGTSSLFGTFALTSNGIAMMNGLPWQYLHQSLICRIDHEVILTNNNLQDIDEDFLDQMIECWELLCDQIEVEVNTALMNV